jgi:hypothetical protein
MEAAMDDDHASGLEPGLDPGLDPPSSVCHGKIRPSDFPDVLVNMAAHQAMTSSPDVRDDSLAPPLSNADLARGGLCRADAWIRPEKSANARRMERKHCKLEDSGLRQVNIVAPIAFHDVLKGIGQRMRAGEDPYGVMLDVIVGGAVSQEGQEIILELIRRVENGDLEIGRLKQLLN